MITIETLSEYLDIAAGYVWGAPLILLLLGTGVFLTIRLRCIQVRKLINGLKIAFSKSDPNAQGDISQFRSLMTALAATVGTGNIVGVASAISIGGPGALFWMWVTALVGMATKYSEAILAVHYRVVDEKGEMVGGPMYALERGLGLRWLGVIFSIFCAIAAFGIGNTVQANSVADALSGTFSIPAPLTGIVMMTLTAAVILGGIKRIGAVTAVFVPVMAVLYIACGAVILILYITSIPAALQLIFSNAFTGTAATGGFAGALIKETIRIGIARGIFANESGMGSAPIAAAAAKTPYPKQQALVSMTGTFIDTIVLCSVTGLVIVCTGAWTSDLTPTQITISAFSAGMPGESAGIVVALGLALFAYSTLLGWCYYGEKCVEYLFGIKAVFPYRIIWTASVYIGATTHLDIVWHFSDIMNGLMAIPNLISLLLLSGVVVYESKRRE